MIKRLRATGLGYYDINNDIYGKSTDLTDAQARNVLAFIMDPTELPELFTGVDQDLAPAYLQDEGWAALKIEDRIGYLGTERDGIHGTDQNDH